MNILVLGGTNFIGRHIVSTLAQYHTVTCLNRGTNPIWVGEVRQVAADRVDPDSMRSALVENYDVVVDVSGTDPIHIASTAPLLKGLGVGKYVFISSGAVYDSKKVGRPFPENAEIAGDAIWGPYGIAKVECEKMLAECEFDELTILRPPYVYGPGNNEQREQFLWARMLDNKPIFVPADGVTEIQFCYVNYLAEVVMSACHGDFEAGIYNVGEKGGYTLNDYIEMLRKASEVPVIDVRHVTDSGIPAREYFPFRDYSLVLDTEAIRKLVAIAPRSLSDGLAETYVWFRANGDLSYVPTQRELEFLRG